MSNPASNPTASSGSIEIVECKTRAERRQFIEFQWEIYKGDSYWVPPLISEREAFYDKTKNPFFEHSDAAMFMARCNGKIAGTIVAIHNRRHNEFQGDKVGFFGGFEVINDFTVAKALLDTARDWVAARGLNVLRGPATLSSNDEYGLLVDGFDSEPQVMMTYNPRYYMGLLERYGLKKAMDLLAWWVPTDIAASNMEGKRFEHVVEMALKRGKFTVREAKLKEFDHEVELVKAVYNSAWARNWGFVPMTDHEIDHLGENLKQIVDPEMVFIAEQDGKPIGVSLSLPDLNRPLRKAYPNPKTPEWWTLLKFLWYRRTMVNSLRLLILGVVPGHRMSGADAVMMYKTLKVAEKKHLIGGELSWILETNDDMNRMIALAGAKVYKTYRMYDYAIA
jgi:hypothetical protein